jgi:NTE family protein
VAPRLPERIALVLGGGGLKGFAHIGAIRALRERGVRPSVVAGSSIGALIAAACAGGMPVDEMEAHALGVTRRDLFRLDHVHMVTQRMRAPSLYLPGPLERVIRRIVPRGTFADLPTPLLVNTVDLERATPVVFGLPGLTHVPVADAVCASCALPGFFPPRVVDGRTCADGGIIDNLPAAVAAYGMDAVIAIDVGSTSLIEARHIEDRGFAAIFVRAAQTMMRTMQLDALAQWSGPPLLLVRPEVWQYGWFSFAHTRRMIDAGYVAMHAALDECGDTLMGGHGVYPRREVELAVDRAKCVGCRLCATLAPALLRMDDEGKAVAVQPTVEWSRADGDFVHRCPTKAITVTVADGDVRRRTMEWRTADR